MTSWYIISCRQGILVHLSETKNDGIHLAVSPQCGKICRTPAAANVSDVNAGLLPLKNYKTIVSFGDSFTAGGVIDGSPLAPPIVIPPNPKAGGRTTNGRVWIEDISVDIGALFKDYAVGGAVTNQTLWPSKGNRSDFVGQVQIFLKQNNSLDPLDTLYTVFFGINDWIASHVDGNHLPQAAQVVLNQIKLLAGPPTFAQHFLVTDAYGRGTHDAAGDAYKLQIYNGMPKLHFENPYLRFAFVDFAPLWHAIVGPAPGYDAFGYTNDGSCTVNSSTTIGACTDPDHTFYWIPGHPSKQTHRIMGDYVEEALYKCGS